MDILQHLTTWEWGIHTFHISLVFPFHHNSMALQAWTVGRIPRMRQDRSNVSLNHGIQIPPTLAMSIHQWMHAQHKIYWTLLNRLTNFCKQLTHYIMLYHHVQCRPWINSFEPYIVHCIYKNVTITTSVLNTDPITYHFLKPFVFCSVYKSFWRVMDSYCFRVVKTTPGLCSAVWGVKIKFPKIYASAPKLESNFPLGLQNKKGKITYPSRSKHYMSTNLGQFPH